MIAIGFDPGTARLGYGVIESEPDPRPVDYGVIVTDHDLPMAERLLVIHDAVIELIDRYEPGAVAVELLFFARNVTTAMTVGQARGVILLAAAQRAVPVAEYAPSEVKQAVVGYGKA
ncbi:MAG: crossover junction endodeoxyribonuclease RuvC, partial [Thermomicrobiales bacterium]|nr:crossover junction endodeoxyribonuclease RuvC [Thermomicrobiales bacterium]